MRNEGDECLQVRHARVSTFKSNPVTSQFAQHFGRGILNELMVRPNVTLQPRAFLADLLGVARVAHQNRSRLGHDQITTVAAKAGQITDIDRIGDQEGIDRFRFQKAA